MHRAPTTLTCHALRTAQMEFPPGMLYHPQVSLKEGKLCSEDISKAFGPTKNVTHLAQLVQALLAAPAADTAPEMDILAEMREKLATYEEKARKMAEAAPRRG